MSISKQFCEILTKYFFNVLDIGDSQQNGRRTEMHLACSWNKKEPVRLECVYKLFLIKNKKKNVSGNKAKKAYVLSKYVVKMVL